jgi:multisubunit Na+/H+ antiporter MnhB subunit
VSFEIAFSVGVAVLILAVAGFAIVSRGSFAAVVAFGVYGLLLSLAWMAIFGPDVALTEAAVGGGVTGARLRGEEHSTTHQPPGPFTRVVALLLCLGVTAGLAAFVLMLPQPAPSLAHEAISNVGPTGLGNPVTAALMAFRALDTMLEKVVLLLAVVAVWSLAADRFWGGRPAYGYAPEAGGPLVFLTRILAPVGIVAGIYLMWVGADAPGGAFAGGAILSAAWLLGFLSGLMVVPKVSGFALRFALAVGVLVFVVVGFAGFAVATGFLAYPANYAKPVIVFVEVAMTLSIGASLGLLVAGAPGQSAKS